MKTAAFVLGLISGIIGLGLAFVTLFMGGLVSALSSDQSVGIMGIFAILLTLLIIVFSSIILAKPKQSGILLIGTSIGCIVSGGTLVAITSVLSLVAGILAYISGRKFNGITPPIKNSNNTFFQTLLKNLFDNTLDFFVEHPEMDYLFNNMYYNIPIPNGTKRNEALEKKICLHLFTFQMPTLFL